MPGFDPAAYRAEQRRGEPSDRRAAAPDPTPSSALAGIRERGYRNGATGAECARLSDAAAVDIPVLVAAVEAVLALADEWEQDARYLDARAERADNAPAASAMLSGRAQAKKDDADELRTRITAALTGEERSDGA